MLPWMKPTVGIGLSDGVGEIDLAAKFEVYSTSYAARPVAIAPDATITTRNGLVLVTTPIGEDPTVDRVVVPGATRGAAINPRLRRWADDRNVTIDPLRSDDGKTGFDAALEDLATHVNSATALTVAKGIEYPVAHLDLSDSGMQWRLPVLLTLSVLLATAMGRATHVALHALRRRRIAPTAA